MADRLDSGGAPSDSAPVLPADAAPAGQGDSRGADAADAQAADVPAPANCAAPTTACGASCVDLTKDLGNCGACGAVCGVPAHATATCAARSCGFVCAAGYADCDGDPKNGCEANLATDVGHCGACGTVCEGAHASVAACTGGVCATSCNAGYFFSDNKCVACSPIEGCMAGVTCTSVTDQQCTACAGGTHLVDGTADLCTACTACAAGSYESAACTTKQDRACSACGSLANCQATTCTTPTDQTCTACVPGRFWNGTSCATCSPACAAGENEATACTTAHDRTCTSCGAIANCTAETCANPAAPVCTACASGFHLSGNACLACGAACGAGTYESATCSTAHDRACTACAAVAGCASAVTCTSATDSQCLSCLPERHLVEGAADVCATCAPACGAGSYERVPCTRVTNRVCQACTAVASCASALTCSNPGNSQCSACAAGTYLVDGTADTCAACTAIPNCTAGLTCTSSMNSQCTTCASGTVLIDGTADSCIAGALYTLSGALADSVSSVVFCHATDNSCTSCGAPFYKTATFIDGVPMPYGTNGTTYALPASTIAAYLAATGAGPGIFHIGMTLRSQGFGCSAGAAQCTTDTDTSAQRLCIQATYTGGAVTGMTQFDNGVAILDVPKVPHAYVANLTNNTISLCSIDSSGALGSCSDSGAVSLNGPGLAQVVQNGSMVYITNQVGASVSVCLAASNGTLSSCMDTGNWGAAFAVPAAMLLSPAANFAYVADFGADVVLGCALNPDGTFGVCQNAGNIGGSFAGPLGLAMNATETVLYVANANNNTVSLCPVNSDGSLATCADAGTGGASLSFPSAVAINDAGTIAYIVNNGNDSVVMCAIGVGGSFTTCANAANSPGFQSPRGIALFNGFAYVTNGGNDTVSQCALNPDGSFGACVDLANPGFSTPQGISIF
jgi:DNA-binding beta-propeller fold protein YncE